MYVCIYQGSGDHRQYGGYPADDYSIRVQRTTEEVQIFMDYPEGEVQSCGEVHLGPAAARWLGLALLKASMEDIGYQKVEIRDDKIGNTKAA
jgi:hypothetical protein